MTYYFDALPPSIFEMVGMLGFATYVVTYGLLTFEKIDSHSKVYFVLNLCAASLVLVGLTHAFNLASAMIQVFWIGISITAIVMRMRPARQDQAGRGQQIRTVKPVA